MQSYPDSFRLSKDLKVRDTSCHAQSSKRKALKNWQSFSIDSSQFLLLYKIPEAGKQNKIRSLLLAEVMK